MYTKRMNNVAKQRKINVFNACSENCNQQQLCKAVTTNAISQIIAVICKRIAKYGFHFQH